MNIFDIFAAASFEYAVYSNLAATDLLILIILAGTKVFSNHDSILQGL